MKNWKSRDSQIEILENRGMTFACKARAASTLQQCGYYRLSGYYHPFRKSEEGQIIDNFEDGTSFDNIADLYEFDKRLRLLALDALERIEVRLQADIAYRLGSLDPCAHLKSSFLDRRFTNAKYPHSKSRFENWIERYKNLVGRSKNKAFVKHNMNTYGELPIWVGVLVWDFGTLSHFFAGMKDQDQTHIAGLYGLPSGKFLKQWIKSFSYIRNISAHQERLWNDSISDVSSVPQHFQKLHNLNNHKPFLYFCLMHRMLRVICPQDNWGERFIDLIESFPNFSDNKVSLSDFGLTDDWKDFFNS